MMVRHVMDARQTNLAEIEIPPTWMSEAARRDEQTATFFADSRFDARRAKAICKQCEVGPQCLAYALARHDTYGVWGGTTRSDRQRMHGIWN
jgi:hypothetical protein